MAFEAPASKADCVWMLEFKLLKTLAGICQALCRGNEIKNLPLTLCIPVLTCVD